MSCKGKNSTEPRSSKWSWILSRELREMEKAAAEGDSCADRINEKYGDLENQQEEIEAAMQRVCPNVAKTMQEIDGDGN